MQVGILHCSLEGFAARRNRIDFFQCAWCWADATSAAWDASLQLGYFCDAKCQRGFETTLAFLCEPEGLSPDGGLFYSTNTKLHQTGEQRGPLPSSGKTQAKSLFLYASAR